MREKTGDLEKARMRLGRSKTRATLFSTEGVNGLAQSNKKRSGRERATKL